MKNKFKFIINHTKIVNTIYKLEQIVNSNDVYIVEFVGLLNNTYKNIIEHDLDEFNKRREELGLSLVDSFKDMIMLQIKEIISLENEEYNYLWNELYGE